MSAIKTVVKYLADKFLTKEDLLPGLLALQTKEDRAAEAISFFRKEAPNLIPGTHEYETAVYAAEDLLLSHFKVGSFVDLCRNQTYKFASDTYYAKATINQIIEAHFYEDALPGTVTSSTDPITGAATVFIANLAEALAAAKAESNYIKRRSIVRKAIVANLPGLSSDRAGQLTELALYVG